MASTKMCLLYFVFFYPIKHELMASVPLHRAIWQNVLNAARHFLHNVFSEVETAEYLLNSVDVGRM